MSTGTVYITCIVQEQRYMTNFNESVNYSIGDIKLILLCCFDWLHVVYEVSHERLHQLLIWVARCYLCHRGAAGGEGSDTFRKKISAFFFNEKLPPTNVCKLRINQSQSGLPTSMKKMHGDGCGLGCEASQDSRHCWTDVILFVSCAKNLWPSVSISPMDAEALSLLCCIFSDRFAAGAHWSQCVWLGYVLVDTQFRVSSWRRWFNSMGVWASSNAVFVHWFITTSKLI